MGNECELLVKLVDVVLVNTKLEMDFDTFFATDGPTNFIDNMAVFLGIDPSKIKIAKITQGSVIIDFVVIPFEVADVASDRPDLVIVNSAEAAESLENSDSTDDVVYDEVEEEMSYEEQLTI